MIFFTNKRNRNKQILLALLCASCTVGTALPVRASSPLMKVDWQVRTVTGKVSGSNGIAIAGASVAVEGTNNSTMTAEDGTFTLNNVPDGATLKVSYLGYVTKSVPVSGQSVLTIVLDEDTQELDDVVVIGYGTMKKSSLTAAVSKMDAKGIENRPLARAESALQGQLAGVQVRTTTGEPGADMQIRVRGAASVNASSDPLYVIDGVPMNTLSGMNPADIESIEVLKDAASSAIYGSRGSNGVVIVTTKKGKTGKPTISFNANYGLQNLEKKMDILSAEEWMEEKLRFNDVQYLRAAEANGVLNASISDSNEQRLINAGVKPGTINYNYVFDERWFNYLSDEIKSKYTYTENPEQLSILDWQDEFYRTAPVQDYNVSISGGTENTKYMFSGGYMSQDGIATGTSYERFSFRTNLESKINKYITAGMSIAPAYTRQDNGGRANGKDSRAMLVLTSLPVSEPGVGYMTNVQPYERYNWAGTASSPTYFMDTNIRHDEIVRPVGSAFVRITPMDGLRVELSGAANYVDLEGSTYTFTSTSPNWAQGEGSQSSGGHNTSRTWRTLLQALVNYDKTFNKHTINAMLGTSAERNNIGFSTNQTFNKPFPNDAITGSFDGSKVAIGASTVSEKTPNRLASVFGRLAYNYDDRYLLSGSLRYDGGSIFGGESKWGIFPAISGGWVISNESFFKDYDLSWWNTLKFRASYGATGNNAISYTAAYPSLTASNYAGMSGYVANTLGNPQLGWEKTHSTDVAVDLGFLQNRIQLSLDWYTKTTKDLLYEVPVYGASGFTTIWDNLGTIANRGFEVELNTKNLTGAFQWNTSFNFAYNKNTVKSLGVDDTPIYSGFDGGNPSNILMVGKPINTFYMFEATGVWMNQQQIDDFSAAHGGGPVTFEGKQIVPGDIRYRDVNGDGIFTAADDKTFLGSPVPTATYGMTNTFAYKNFDLSVLITAQTGGKIYGVVGRAIDRPSMGAGANAMGHWRDAWWSEDEPGNGSVPYLLSTTTGTTLDSRWLYSSNYLRIRNVMLGYRIPVQKSLISNARVFLSVENLAKWDSYYGGYSPEAANTAPSGAPGGQSAVGLDYSGYPIPRIYTFGVNLTF